MLLELGPGLRTRWHVAGRWRLGALDRIEPLVPSVGRTLDIGCGHGLLVLHLALGGEARRVHGVDATPEKVTLARAAAAAGVDDRVTFETVDRDWTPPAAAHNAVTIADMLYLMDAAAIARTVDRALDALVPGGLLIIKVVADRPLWKHRSITVQEVVRIARITEGGALNMRPLDTVLEAVARRGMVARVDAIDRGLSYPHALVVVEIPR